MKRSSNDIANHSILNNETAVNSTSTIYSRSRMEYAVSNRDLNQSSITDDFWDRFYVMPNTNECYMVVRVMGTDGAERFVASAKEIDEANSEDASTNKKKIRDPVPKISIKSNGRTLFMYYLLDNKMELKDVRNMESPQIRELCEEVVRIEGNTGTRMDTFTIGVMEAIFNIYRRRCSFIGEFVEIRPDEILEFMDYQKKKSGNKRRGGYEPEQLDKVIVHLEKLGRLYVKTTTTERVNGREEPVEIKGRLIHIDAEKSTIKDGRLYSCKICIGELMQHAIREKKWAVVPKEVFKYREPKAKLLKRYLERQARNNQKDGVRYLTHKVTTLMDEMSFDPHTGRYAEHPGRAKKDFEKILDVVCGKSDGKRNWEYKNWNEAKEKNKGWLQKFLDEASVCIKIPEEVVNHYEENINDLPQRKKEPIADLGLKLKEARERLNLSPKEASKQIGIDEITLYRIEKGKTKRPNRTTRKACLEWLAQVEKKLNSKG